MSWDSFGFSVGPLLGEPQGLCFECLSRRRYVNVNEPEQLKHFEDWASSKNAIEWDNGFGDSLWNCIRMELFKLRTKAWISPTLTGQLLWDTVNHVTDFHEVLPTPICNVCTPQWKTPPLRSGLVNHEPKN